MLRIETLSIILCIYLKIVWRCSCIWLGVEFIHSVFFPKCKEEKTKIFIICGYFFHCLFYFKWSRWMVIIVVVTADAPSTVHHTLHNLCLINTFGLRFSVPFLSLSLLLFIDAIDFVLYPHLWILLWLLLLLVLFLSIYWCVYAIEHALMCAPFTRI